VQLISDGLSIGREGGEIDHDQVRAEPARGVNGEGGIVFFADGIFTRGFKSTPHDARNSRVMIDEKNFFQYFHELPLLRASVMPVAEEPQGRAVNCNCTLAECVVHLGTPSGQYLTLRDDEEPSKPQLQKQK